MYFYSAGSILFLADSLAVPRRCDAIFHLYLFVVLNHRVRSLYLRQVYKPLRRAPLRVLRYHISPVILPEGIEVHRVSLSSLCTELPTHISSTVGFLSRLFVSKNLLRVASCTNFTSLALNSSYTRHTCWLKLFTILSSSSIFHRRETLQRLSRSQ